MQFCVGHILFAIIIYYFGCQPCCFLDIKKTQSNAISIYGVKLCLCKKMFSTACMCVCGGVFRPSVTPARASGDKE